jgi:CRP-like cAMP-binding protein
VYFCLDRFAMSAQNSSLAALRSAILKYSEVRPESLIRLKLGQRLITQGEISDTCFLIKEGSVGISVRQPGSNQDVTVALRTEGDLVGEMAFLQRSSPRTASVQVASETACFVRLSKAALFELLRQDPSLQDSVTLLWELAASRYEETNEVLDRRITVENRVMTVILSDIHNFTALGEATWEEQSNVFLFDFMESCEAISTEFNGSFDDQGDGHKITMLNADHVERAIRCAVAMADAFVTLRARWIEHNDAFSNVGLGIGICTDCMSIRRLVKPYPTKGRVLSHAINIAAAMSKFKMTHNEVEIYLDENTALLAKSKDYRVERPNQRLLERLGRLHSMYRIQRSQIHLPVEASTGEISAKTEVQTTKPRLGKRKISILFLSSEPENEVKLRLAAEAREIEQKLRGSKYRDRFVFVQRGAVRAADMSQAMLDLKPQIVHFSGHGASKGEILLEDSSGQNHFVAPQALAALFREFTDHVQCVVLNACYSEAQAREIAKHVNYVIGMHKSIEDEAAIAFSVGLYQAIGAGKTIDEAYRLGCVQIDLAAGGAQGKIPILIKKVSATL